MATALIKLRMELKQQADEKTKQSTQRFSKEKMKLYGVKITVKSYWNM